MDNDTPSKGTQSPAAPLLCDPLVRMSAILHLLDEYIATSEGPTKVTLRAIRYDVVWDLHNTGLSGGTPSVTAICSRED